MKQLQAGYYLEAIKNLFSHKQFDNQINNLLYNLSFFDIETNIELKKNINNSTVSVINNIITRGLPTRPSVFIEDTFSEIFSQTIKHISASGNIKYSFFNDKNKDLILRALHIIDPRIKNPFSLTGKNKKDKFKSDFIEKTIPNQIGEHLLQQIQINRTYKSLEKENYFLNFEIENYYTDDEFQLTEQKADILIELPYIVQEKKGIVIEIDPDESPGNTDFILIEKKKKKLKELNYDYLIFKKGLINKTLQDLEYFTFNDFFDAIKKNYNSPLYKLTPGLDALQMSLSPFAIAAIQKTIIEFIVTGKLNLNAAKWDIAVIERDVPAAYLAIEDLKQHFENIYTLRGENKSFPKVNLSIFVSPEYKKAKLNKLCPDIIHEIDNFDSEKTYDLLIDISKTQKSGFSDTVPDTKAINIAKIRSSHYIRSKRKFYTDKLISYKALKKCEENNDKKEVINSLHYFLKNLFRKNKFYETQINTINKALQLKSVTQISPPASGKTLIYQFCSLLQPGISIIVNPFTTIMKEQFKQLRAENIDGSYYINSAQRKVLKKREAADKFINSASLITYISAEKFRSSPFREKLTEMKSENICFAYLVIDEIHCLSESSDDFKPSYVNLIKNVNTFCKNKGMEHIPVIGLSSTSTYSIETDITNELNISLENLLISEEDNRKINYKIIKTGAQKKSLDDTEKKIAVSANQKQVKIIQILKEISPEDNDTLIICPNKTGLFGLKSETGDSITDKIKKTFPKLSSGVYYGAIDTERESISGEDANISEDNYFKFKNGNINILTASETAGIGFDKKDIKNIILFNFPKSPEKLYQIIGRLGRDGKPSTIYILYDDTETEIFEYTDTARADGSIETMEQYIKASLDSVMCRRKVIKKFKGRKKELTILKELIHKISIPEQIPSNEIERSVYLEFGEKVQLHSRPENDPYQISVTKNNKSYGYIDYRDSEINVKNSAYNKIISVQILSFVKNELLKKFGQNKNFFSLLKTKTPKNFTNGISVVLNSLNIKDKAEIEICFNNNTLYETLNILRNFVSKKFSIDNIRKAFENNNYHQGFINELNTTFNTNFVNSEIDIPKELSRMFYEYRNKYDTELALHRLQTINIIDDYEINSANDKFVIKITKRYGFEYKESLKSHFQRYISKQKIIDLLKIIENSKENSILYDSLKLLINFTYDNIIADKFITYERSEKFCSAILKERLSASRLRKQVRTFFIDIFESKYLNSLFRPSLTLETVHFNKSDFNTVLRFIRIIGNSLNNREHLFVSTEHALEHSPDNFTLLLLNAYTRFWKGPQDQENFDTAFERLSKGFLLADIKDNPSFEENIDRKNLFLENLYSQDYDLREHIEPLFFVKTHANWLTDFNSKFLKGFPVQV